MFQVCLTNYYCGSDTWKICQSYLDIGFELYLQCSKRNPRRQQLQCVADELLTALSVSWPEKEKKKKEAMHAWQELNASVRKHYVAVAWSFHSLCTRKCHSCIMRNPNLLFELQHMVNGFPHSAWTIWFLLFSPVLPLLDSVLLSYYSTSQFLLGKHPASFSFNSRHSSTFPVGGRCGLKPFIFPRSVWPTCHWHARHRSGI